MSPESTAVYYEYITRQYTERFGDFGYPEILIYSVSFQKFVDWQRQGRWREAAGEMAGALERLRLAGADFGLIATNTMHIVFDEVQAMVGMPLLSIVEATAESIAVEGLGRIGLLGTVFTMRERFFQDGLRRAGIDVVTPEEGDQERMNAVIYGELCRGLVREESRSFFLDVVGRLRGKGAQGIVLGCTEIPLLIGERDCELPLFNTTILHARKALEFALRGSETLERE